MNASDMVRAALSAKKRTQKELAEFMGWSQQNLSYRLKAGTLTFDELAKALSFAGYVVKNLVPTEADAVQNIQICLTAGQHLAQQTLRSAHSLPLLTPNTCT